MAASPGDAAAGEHRSGPMPLLALVTVRGPSMAPALRDGDRVLARRIRSPARVRGGAIVLVNWAAHPGLLAIKRIVRPVSGGHWVEGDNPFGSSDSRTHGPATIHGVVLARCWPWPPWIGGRFATLRR